MLTLAVLIAPAWATSIISSSSSSVGSILTCALRAATFVKGDEGMGAGSLISTSAAGGGKGKSSSMAGISASSSITLSSPCGVGGNASSLSLGFLAVGRRASRTGESARCLRRSGDLFRLEGRGTGAGMLLSTSPSKSARNLSSSSVLTT